MTTSEQRRAGWDDLDQRIAIDPDKPLEILVSNNHGEIAVRATDAAEVRIRTEGSRRAARHGGLDVHAEVAVEVEDDANRIVVGTDSHWSLGLGELARGLFGRGKRGDAPEFDDDVPPAPARGPKGRRGGRVDIAIEIPRRVVETRATLRTASGDISAEGISGALSATAASGDIALRRLAGSISAHTASGDIMIHDAVGALRLRSASGDVHVREADLHRYQIQTASGDVQLGQARLVAAGPFAVESVSGDVTLDHGVSPAAGERGAILEFKSVSGDARVAPPLASTGHRTWQAGPGGEGCLKIAVRTVSGDLVARLEFDAGTSRAPDLALPPNWSADEGGARPVAWDEEGVVPPMPPAPPMPPMPPFPAGSFVGLKAQIKADVDAAMAEARRAIEEAMSGPAGAIAGTTAGLDAARQAMDDVRRAFDDARRAQDDAERDAHDAELDAVEAELDAAEAELDAAEAELDAAEAELETAEAEREVAEDNAAWRREVAEDNAAWRSESASLATEPSPGGDSVAIDPEREAARLAVLTALEEGEIDVDEALRRLEPLGGEPGDLAQESSLEER